MLSQLAQPSAGLTVLSAMITPAVLILATGSLLMTTSQRLSRSIDRARKLSAAIEEIALDPAKRARRDMLLGQLHPAAERTRLLQRGMVCLYVAQGMFVATSMVIGLLEFIRVTAPWVSGALGMAGAILLLAASAVLIRESRIALRAVEKEMTTLTRECRECEEKLREKIEG